MSLSDLCFKTMAELAPLIERRELSPVELTAAVLARIERLNPKLNAYITLTADKAMDSARQAEREIASSSYRGPLHGIPISLKDLYYTKGERTTGGSKILADFVPDHDAAVVERLRAAGAVILGKLNMHEFAFGPNNINPHYGPTRNPWNREHITGGSSGGSGAAVAAGLGVFSLGSDTGGSIRVPAACCGTVGLKPTYGRVSRYGVIPLSWSADTLGPLTRCVADAAAALQVLAGHDPRDAASSKASVPDFTAGLERPVRGLRLGIPSNYFFEGLQPEVRKLLAQAIDVFRDAGVVIEDIALPHVEEAGEAIVSIFMIECAAYHADWLRARPADYGEDVRSRLELASMLPAIDYVQAQRARALCCQEYGEVFRKVDALFAPTLPAVAPGLGEKQVTLEDRVENSTKTLTRFTRLYNALGVPAIAMPCGFAGGLPASFQLAARPFAEETVLRLASAYEQRTNWRSRRPED